MAEGAQQLANALRKDQVQQHCLFFDLYSLVKLFIDTNYNRS